MWIKLSVHENDGERQENCCEWLHVETSTESENLRNSVYIGSGRLISLFTASRHRLDKKLSNYSNNWFVILSPTMLFTFASHNIAEGSA